MDQETEKSTAGNPAQGVNGSNAAIACRHAGPSRHRRVPYERRKTLQFAKSASYVKLHGRRISFRHGECHPFGAGGPQRGEAPHEHLIPETRSLHIRRYAELRNMSHIGGYEADQQDSRQTPGSGIESHKRTTPEKNAAARKLHDVGHETA